MLNCALVHQRQREVTERSMTKDGLKRSQQESIGHHLLSIRPLGTKE